jgi:hypothetical protein
MYSVDSPRAHAFVEELQRQRGLAGAGFAFDQVQPVAGEAAVQHLVQAGYPGREKIGGDAVLSFHGDSESDVR